MYVYMYVYCDYDSEEWNWNSSWKVLMILHSFSIQIMQWNSFVFKVTAPGGKRPEGIEVTLNPEELDLDTAAMQAKYDQTLKEQQSQLEKEDLSDMVAEHAAKQKVAYT